MPTRAVVNYLDDRRGGRFCISSQNRIDDALVPPQHRFRSFRVAAT